MEGLLDELEKMQKGCHYEICPKEAIQNLISRKINADGKSKKALEDEMYDISYTIEPRSAPKGHHLKKARSAHSLGSSKSLEDNQESVNHLNLESSLIISERRSLTNLNDIDKHSTNVAAKEVLGNSISNVNAHSNRTVKASKITDFRITNKKNITATLSNSSTPEQFSSQTELDDKSTSSNTASKSIQAILSNSAKIGNQMRSRAKTFTSTAYSKFIETEKKFSSPLSQLQMLSSSPGEFSSIKLDVLFTRREEFESSLSNLDSIIKWETVLAHLDLSSGSIKMYYSTPKSTKKAGSSSSSNILSPSKLMPSILPKKNTKSGNRGEQDAEQQPVRFRSIRKFLSNESFIFFYFNFN
jgi:hypothetical protein